MATSKKKSPASRQLHCSGCSKKRKMYLVRTGPFGGKYYQCPTCGKEKCIDS